MVGGLQAGLGDLQDLAGGRSHHRSTGKACPATGAGVRGVDNDAVGLPALEGGAGCPRLLARLAGRLPQGLVGDTPLLGFGGTAGTAVGAVPGRRKRGGGRISADLGLKILQPGAELLDQRGLSFDDRPEP
jgi:hypothetical protein